VYDIKKVLDGKVPDPILQPNDIVYLPPGSPEAIPSRRCFRTTLGLVSLAIALK